jgi:hypothetical protein
MGDKVIALADLAIPVNILTLFADVLKVVVSPTNLLNIALSVIVLLPVAS